MPSAPLPPTDLPTHTFPTAQAFTTFLQTNHLTAPGIYLKLAKKSSGIPSITADEAVECALCYGWIDGRANSVDQSWWTVRFTPRRKKSVWSKKNVNTVGRLIEEGRMMEAGLEKVNEAKEDGRWERAYAGPAGIVVPEDFKQLLGEEQSTTAKEIWDGLTKSERYAVLWRVETASVKAREGVMKRLVEGLSEGKVPGMGGGEKKKAKEKTEAKAKGKTKVTKDAVEKKGVKAALKAKATSTTAQKVITATDNSKQPRRPGLRARP